MHSKRVRKISRKFQVRFQHKINRNKVIFALRKDICLFSTDKELFCLRFNITIRIIAFNIRLNKVFRLKLTLRNSFEQLSLFVSV